MEKRERVAGGGYIVSLFRELGYYLYNSIIIKHGK